jgi:hypothetical protein
MQLTSKLESAETSLILKTAQLHLKAPGTPAPTDQDVEASPVDSSSKSVLILPDDQRPHHKLGFLSLFGQKVDTINWAREEIAKCNVILEEGKNRIEAYDEVDFEAFEAENEEDLGDTDEGGTLTDEGAPTSAGAGGFNPRVVGHQAKNMVGKASKTAMKGVVESGKAIRERVSGHILGSEEEYPRMNSAFVMFRRQIAAHVAAQVVAHHEPYRMSKSFLK